MGRVFTTMSVQAILTTTSLMIALRTTLMTKMTSVAVSMMAMILLEIILRVALMIADIVENAIIRAISFGETNWKTCSDFRSWHSAIVDLRSSAI